MNIWGTKVDCIVLIYLQPFSIFVNDKSLLALFRTLIYAFGLRMLRYLLLDYFSLVSNLSITEMDSVTVVNK